jgi:hypothetical protein
VTRPRRGLAAAALGLYGVWLAAAGVLGALGFGGAAQGADAERARPLAPAPVVAPPPGPLPAGRAESSGPAGPVPSASVGRELPAAAVFAPTGLVLPDGTSASVVPVGLHPDGALVVPDDVSTIGWWTGGSRVGEPFGSVVVAGHVDSATRGVGVFARLKRLEPGQVVTLTAGARRASYRIASATLVPQARLAQDAGIFRVDGEPQLVLVTCGGPFDPVRHRYQDNLVVIATPL